MHHTTRTCPLQSSCAATELGNSCAIAGNLTCHYCPIDAVTGDDWVAEGVTCFDKQHTQSKPFIALMEEECNHEGLDCGCIAGYSQSDADEDACSSTAVQLLLHTSVTAAISKVASLCSSIMEWTVVTIAVQARQRMPPD